MIKEKSKTTTLSDKERQKIKEEEKLRVELRKKEEKKQQSKKATGCLILILIPVIIIVIAVITSSGGDKESSGTTPSTKSIQFITESGTPERAIEAKFTQILGEKTNMKEQRVRQIKIYTYDYVNNYQNVDIEYMADENLTTNLTRRGMWLDAIKILKGLPAVLKSQVMKMTLNPYLKLVDKYGEETIDKVMTIRITRETWEKINWSNFLTDNVPNIAETYWEHPALKK